MSPSAAISDSPTSSSVALVAIHSDSQSQGEASWCGSGLSASKSKKGKRMSKWKEEWKWYNMKGSKRELSFNHCNTCCTDFLYRTTISDSLFSFVGWVGWGGVGWGRGVLLDEAKSCQIALPVIGWQV